MAVQKGRVTVGGRLDAGGPQPREGVGGHSLPPPGRGHCHAESTWEPVSSLIWKLVALDLQRDSPAGEGGKVNGDLPGGGQEPPRGR